MINVGIVGATGYTGLELMRLLSAHPEISLGVVTSRIEQGKSVSKLFPSLTGHIDLEYSAPDSSSIKQCDLVFFATPNATAMHQVPELLDAGVKVIDLSADFRIKDAQVWEKWYGEKHACPELLDKAVYGLPEINRGAVRNADLVANPGCYPTSIILALLPVLEHGTIDISAVIADSKSGVSGAGRNLKTSNLYAEVAESFKAYGVSGHRHHPEISQILSLVAGDKVSLIFTPHLVPMIRGIHSTVYAPLQDRHSDLDVQELYEERYKKETFVKVMGQGSYPDTKNVRGTNTCQIAVFRPLDTSNIIVLSVIDNLVKGAAGQAVQNMNIMFGLKETTGLSTPAFYP